MSIVVNTELGLQLRQDIKVQADWLCLDGFDGAIDPGLVAHNQNSTLLVLAGAQARHFNLDDLCALAAQFREGPDCGQVFSYGEIETRPGESAFTYSWESSGEARRLEQKELKSGMFHDAFFPEPIFLLPPKALRPEQAGSSFARYTEARPVLCLPMPKFHAVFPQGKAVAAMFYDRDGVINVDKSYVFQSADCQFIPQAFDLMEWARGKGLLQIVLTNQSGIGRGMYTEADTERLHRWMGEQLLSRGHRIERFEMAPYHHQGLTEHYRKYSHLRKPYPGMALRVGDSYPLSLRRSLMIGDKESDALWLPLIKTYLIQGRYNVRSVFSKFPFAGPVTVCRDHAAVLSALHENH